MNAEWRPVATPEALRLRADLNALIRRFFADRGVLEVETPILSAAGNTDPNIASFSLGTGSAESALRWLRTSPEFAIKRLLAAGIGDCYELGRVFRRGEAGRNHNPEFTMLEWYRLGWDHRRLMGEVAELVAIACTLVSRKLVVRECSYHELYRDVLGVDAFTDGNEVLRAALGDISIDPGGLTRDDWLDLLMTHRIQPRLCIDELLLVYDYPASQCALARVRDDRAGDATAMPVAERFEAYLGPLELANGYHELTDAIEQRTRFERDLGVRRQRHESQPALDERLLVALQHGLPPCAGVALGVDRLLAAMLGGTDVAATLAFPFDRA